MNENRPQDPEADLARSRQSIKEAKEAAAAAELTDPAEGEAAEAQKTDPPERHGEEGTDPGM
ncbi:hypothetical protein [Amycolatopsis sp. cg9]|uniref:hypothetical protein n=1 Tax=Amycolatopsis sp. cg9 TaxID=3238801 RepID=UPI003526A996